MPVPGTLRTERTAHIGAYFRWCVHAGLVSDFHTEDEETAPMLEQVRSGEVTGTEYLWENCSGKFTDEDLTDEGNRFTAIYYNDLYYEEFRKVTGGEDYSHSEAELDYPELARRLDERLTEFRSDPDAWGRKHKKRPWWKFWS